MDIAEPAPVPAPLPSFQRLGDIAIRQEGLGMLKALLRDFETLPQIKKISTILDARLGEKINKFRSKIEFIEVSKNSSESFLSPFKEQLEQSGCHLIIAPELGDWLKALNYCALNGNSLSLGVSIEGLEVFSNKLSTWEFFEQNQIPTPKLIELSDLSKSSKIPFPLPWVVKPACGAGALNTVKISSPEDFGNFHLRHRYFIEKNQMTVSPFVEGEVVSVSYIYGTSSVYAFPPCQQAVYCGNETGTFYYHNLPQLIHDPQLLNRIEKLSQLWLNSNPPLRGFVGVDMIIGKDESEDVILEVNPRVTSSYLTLTKELKDINIAQLWLEMLEITDPVH